MKKFKIGVLTFGDGREFLKRDLEPVNAKFQQKVKSHLEADGFEVAAANEVIWNNRLAVKYGKWLRAEDVDCVMFNYCVWAWPGFARMAAQFCPKPIILYANVNPGYPAMVGMLANAGSLDQVGIPFFKVFGELSDPAIYHQLKSALLGVAAYNRLRGQTYVSVGGRSLSIDTTVADPALWMQKFGIDVDHVDQMELVRRAELELKEGTKVQKAFDYLKKNVRKIHFTDAGAKMKLTEELLRRAIAMYYGMVSLCEEFGYDFAGIKGQRELTEHYCTSDVPEAFLNDFYGPAGEPHDPIVCATEADMDAALTMRIFNLVSGKPALFADIRSYYEDRNVWDLCNSGSHATYFAAKSDDPVENLKNVEFRPEGFYYPAGGPSVYHVAKPGEVTLARLVRSGSTTHYKLVVVRGEFVTFGSEEDEKLGAIEQDNWPHAFVRLSCTKEEFIQGMSCNHIHGTYGDWVDALKAFCKAADVECVVL
ncbi:MAG: L-fucose/L-arabinose isomerase family protein [Spirochaetales bacterium]|nr:L-fucose/L-arabinose isomerase family protein [Spirochaetales bacterium]